MKQMKKERGITLIALIITIIVMLILVAVTVAFAMNSGLFNRAKEGSAKTEKQVIYEMIMGNLELYTTGDNIGAVDVYTTATNSKTALENDGKQTTISPTPTQGMSEATLTVEGGTGIYKYKITESGITIIEEPGENTPTPLSADWYILTPEEKEEIRNKNKAITVTEDGSGLPIGTEIFIIGEIGSFDIKYIEMSGPEEFINIILGNNYLFYGADEENAAIISGYGVTPNVWLNSEYAQYTGPCLTQLYEIMYNKNEICYCESYLTRMINSFGTPSWYDIHSQEEYNEIAGKGGLIEDNGIDVTSEIEHHTA